MEKEFKIGIIAVGFVGGAINESLKMKGLLVDCYDKYKNIGSFEKVIENDILFLCLLIRILARFLIKIRLILFKIGSY